MSCLINSSHHQQHICLNSFLFVASLLKKKEKKERKKERKKKERKKEKERMEQKKEKKLN